MRLGKKELVISIIMVLVIMVGALFTTTVLAANEENRSNTVWDRNESNSTNNVSNGTTPNETSNNTANKNANTNKPSEMANTGLEDLPWITIVACGAVAVFAYKKIKEYNVD